MARPSEEEKPNLGGRHLLQGEKKKKKKGDAAVWEQVDAEEPEGAGPNEERERCRDQ